MSRWRNNRFKPGCGPRAFPEASIEPRARVLYELAPDRKTAPNDCIECGRTVHHRIQPQGLYARSHLRLLANGLHLRSKLLQDGTRRAGWGRHADDANDLRHLAAQPAGFDPPFLLCS